MPYQRTTWTSAEICRALANPTHAESGPHAHSSIHAVSGELAQHAMFQRARVSQPIHDGRAVDSNYDARQQLEQQQGRPLSNRQMRRLPVPEAAAGKHSTLDDVSMANALCRVFNSAAMHPHLGTLDGGSDIKVHVNFTNTIGQGWIHETGQPSQQANFVSLFVYLKPNPGNRDIPIFQTIVPSDQHKVGGGDPIIAIP